jgi:hypothetical protein
MGALCFPSPGHVVLDAKRLVRSDQGRLIHHEALMCSQVGVENWHQKRMCLLLRLYAL